MGHKITIQRTNFIIPVPIITPSTTAPIPFTIETPQQQQRKT